MQKQKRKMLTNDLAGAQLTNSQLISDNYKKQILIKMNKKVRRKVRWLSPLTKPTIKTLDFASTTSSPTSSLETTPTKFIFISLLTLWHLFALTLCIGKLKFLHHFLYHSTSKEHNTLFPIRTLKHTFRFFHLS